ncbi:hypothetical protein G9A89_023921 [Geosiphon pyriformis]|nr:hypothetical protein G9A89_023921 [Geosiphon pyriformis]
MIPIKVLVIEATQYQALVGNDWLSKTNTILNWMMQKLQLSQNGQHTEASAVLWADVDHNELLPILAWDEDNHRKGKQKEEHIWETTIGAWIDDNQNELLSTLSWEEKGKGKKKKDNILEKIESTKDITSGWTCSYSIYKPLPQPPYIPLKCKDCEKKLFFMKTWIVPDENYWMRTHYYCKPCHRECYGYPKQQGKWNNKSCLACSEQLLDEEIWNDIPG